MSDSSYFWGVENSGFTPEQTDRIIEMAWEDRTPFEAITYQFGITEDQVISLMRTELKPGSFKRWRRRVQGRSTKHQKLRDQNVIRFKCSRQKNISGNAISKRRN
ncbi:TIGR03643 family protein [Robiginitalea aurantiaca]|uniref:TIGR03643 family protein n=1 Tax=Robiginitalea aurantiaca TaxID=3056915 RepID=A0ABT7WGE8_9FLAO|nr:TIGR03643 family protein [Robiginitalea aurantiaca]MDM9631997.1 TIGR03643 family protein [Robiginitalea aurantiaca]